MSKLNLTQLEDNDFLLNTVTALCDAFKTQTNRFPNAIVITKEQGLKHFILGNNEIMSNYKGVPVEVESPNADESKTILKTINGFISALHIARVKEVVDVYAMLEIMKEKLTGENK